ncbi:probable beta-1,4-xylosyltransferase IRX9H [Gossypium arboreum]|uniref:Glycosyltransferases n=1 Tax=Gossypium arboreum TaxID=29729 RepID=A0ABR0MIP3_GOSAR|nr:probable beta-1,4-xylosyltransferase IRX9H [Gossypium arboreum]KAK5773151.1 hypothetical protein PVK06_049456 [Gossypium arboreum]
MASIRRTLSPLPRQGTSNTGEEAERSVPSPLSNPASCNENYPPIGGRLLSSLFGLSESRPLILSVFWTKSARPFNRSKQKEQIWKRVLLHFFICFIVGLLIGLTPFISMDISYTNPSSKGQAFSYGIVSTVGNSLNLDNKGVDDNVGNLDNAMTNPSLLVDKNQETRKLLIVVTPTYTRPLQAYYLNRLAYTLKLAKPPLLWIVVEMNLQSEETADILRRSSVMYRHLVCKRNLTDIKDRQVHQRNVALSHIETHRLDGIIYFANEDNVYSIDLFQQMRHIRQFGTWTVAKQTWDKSRFGLEGPVCNGAQVIGWHLNRLSRRFRRFHAEMSGFAFNSTILWDQKRWHRPPLEPIRQLDTVKDGFQVSSFIEQVVEDESRMEGLPLDYSRIMVWELSIESSNSFYPQKWSVKNYLDVIAPLA